MKSALFCWQSHDDRLLIMTSQQRKANKMYKLIETDAELNLKFVLATSESRAELLNDATMHVNGFSNATPIAAHIGCIEINKLSDLAQHNLSIEKL